MMNDGCCVYRFTPTSVNYHHNLSHVTAPIKEF